MQDFCFRQRIVTKDQCNTLYCHMIKVFFDDNNKKKEVKPKSEKKK